MEHIKLGEASVRGYKAGRPIYGVNISLDDNWKKINQTKDYYLAKLGEGNDGNLYLYASREKLKPRSTDICNVFIHINELKNSLVNRKGTIFIAPHLLQDVSDNISKSSHEVYTHNGEIIKSIGYGYSLQKDKKFEPYLASRFDYNVVGSMDREGSIKIGKKSILDYMNSNSQNAVTINFHHYANKESYYAYISDKGNLNPNFDFKVILPRTIIESDYHFSQLQALIVNKPSQRNDMIVVTMNEYLNALNDYFLCNKKNILFDNSQILAKGWSKEAYQIDVTQNRNTKANNNQSEAGINNIPTVEKIKFGNGSGELKL